MSGSRSFNCSRSASSGCRSSYMRMGQDNSQPEHQRGQEIEMEKMSPSRSPSLKRGRKEEEENIAKKKDELVEVGRRRLWTKPSPFPSLLHRPKKEKSEKFISKSLPCSPNNFQILNTPTKTAPPKTHHLKTPPNKSLSTHLLMTLFPATRRLPTPLKYKKRFPR